ncbi:hypothetical protein [Lutimaribacter saemankumensis]|uniref:Uncharacterized protein n=1 Tax=Lutimaribacter saemankumensis TaxID=490829 RepID=A0A1G8K1P7_9RHOB|nr:hypothetical protein [Lutimaribacter saemankumensis]SDI37338.1 hypothetical protein SAMN05421850_102363 [Lutimaribacter saemankumensis]
MTIARRPPEQVMRLSRLGSLHACRLSFMRQLTRRMAAENWQFARTEFDIDATGKGHAVYTATGPERSYSLVAFAHDLPDEKRSDRVIADAWDATFALFDGVPTKADITRLAKNVPRQEAGRISETELSLSRANRSVRLWEHVVDALADGRQPDASEIAQVGYLMRTTAVYGSGKFGAADREMIADRPEMQAPFQAEMLSVYLTRWFVRDLVEHIAHARGGAGAARLDPHIARRLGIGNSTGLGMAPFIINHPVLFNNWIMAREEAIARVRAVEHATSNEISQFHEIFRRANASVDDWRSEHPWQIEKLTALRADIARLRGYFATHEFTGTYPWDRLASWAEKHIAEDAQEWLLSLMLEPYARLVDDLGGCMADPLGPTTIDGAMPVGQVRALLKGSFEWALDLDWDAPENCARLWYVSEEKLEPRLGARFDEPLEPYEQPLAPARDAAAAYRELARFGADTPIAEFLEARPEFRHVIRRAQIAGFAPYAEIRDNTIGADVMPIDMLRAKLSFFGATHFDPRSDRWVRICMYAGAPYPDELTPGSADFWNYPEVAA